MWNHHFSCENPPHVLIPCASLRSSGRSGDFSSSAWGYARPKSRGKGDDPSWHGMKMWKNVKKMWKNVKKWDDPWDYPILIYCTGKINMKNEHVHQPINMWFPLLVQRWMNENSSEKMGLSNSHPFHSTIFSVFFKAVWTSIYRFRHVRMTLLG